MRIMAHQSRIRGRRHRTILRTTGSPLTGTTTRDHLVTYEKVTATRQVDFLVVHELVAPILQEVSAWPVAGTLLWAQLPTTDPAKWCALLDAARYQALQMQVQQEHLEDAAKSIAGSQEWADVRNDSRRHAQALRSGAYIPRRSA